MDHTGWNSKSAVDINRQQLLIPPRALQSAGFTAAFNHFRLNPRVAAPRRQSNKECHVDVTLICSGSVNVQTKRKMGDTVPTSKKERITIKRSATLHELNLKIKEIFDVLVNFELLRCSSAQTGRQLESLPAVQTLDADELPDIAEEVYIPASTPLVSNTGDDISSAVPRTSDSPPVIDVLIRNRRSGAAADIEEADDVTVMDTTANQTPTSRGRRTLSLSRGNNINRSRINCHSNDADEVDTIVEQASCECVPAVTSLDLLIHPPQPSNIEGTLAVHNDLLISPSAPTTVIEANVINDMSECTVDGQVRDLYRTIMDEATDAGFIVPIMSFPKISISTLQAALIENQVSSCKDELDQFIQA